VGASEEEEDGDGGLGTTVVGDDVYFFVGFEVVSGGFVTGIGTAVGTGTLVTKGASVGMVVVVFVLLWLVGAAVDILVGIGEIVGTCVVFVSLSLLLLSLLLLLLLLLVVGALVGALVGAGADVLSWMVVAGDEKDTTTALFLFFMLPLLSEPATSTVVPIRTNSIMIDDAFVEIEIHFIVYG